MNATSASRMTIRRPVAAAALIAALALAGCQSGSVTPTVPTPVAVQAHHFPAAPKAPVGVDTQRSADRLAEDIQRNSDRMSELAKRFAGVPADRVEEQLAREAAAAKAGH